jgi:hypothetical protein
MPLQRATSLAAAAVAQYEHSAPVLRAEDHVKFAGIDEVAVLLNFTRHI